MRKGWWVGEEYGNVCGGNLQKCDVGVREEEDDGGDIA